MKNNYKTGNRAMDDYARRYRTIPHLYLTIDALDSTIASTQFIRETCDRWAVTFVLISPISRKRGRYVRSGDTGEYGKGRSLLGQLVDYEIELLADAPLYDGGG
jgi:hypothetical protein